MFNVGNGDDNMFYEEPANESVHITDDDLEEFEPDYVLPISALNRKEYNPVMHGMTMLKAKNVRKAMELGKFRN